MTDEDGSITIDDVEKVYVCQEMNRLRREWYESDGGKIGGAAAMWPIHLTMAMNHIDELLGIIQKIIPCFHNESYTKKSVMYEANDSVSCVIRTTEIEDVRRLPLDSDEVQQKLADLGYMPPGDAKEYRDALLPFALFYHGMEWDVEDDETPVRSNSDYAPVFRDWKNAFTVIAEHENRCHGCFRLLTKHNVGRDACHCDRCVSKEEDTDDNSDGQ